MGQLENLKEIAAAINKKKKNSDVELKQLSFTLHYSRRKFYCQHKK